MQAFADKLELLQFLCYDRSKFGFYKIMLIFYIIVCFI
ncbi:hypothetical protein RUMOBE_03181 [Blautia obeum ATCC 29174]|uniref:Uncharacterized protein n=1 Tax=Blautia obeum ATCC 29174 TaxID=411459 RepID=A5ZVY8_9FIRM|nr:hypothetical protein RUMOBE_03181 [Blautia obeum ATCC 29174]